MTGPVKLWPSGPDYFHARGEDANLVAGALGLAVTQDRDGMPICVLPAHRLLDDLRALNKAGLGVEVRA